MYALPVYGILDVFTDLKFVLQVIVFSYILFWLYMTFRDVQVLFGLGAIVAAYFVLLNPISTTVLLVLFFAFVLMGMHFQMLFQFGLFPLLRFFGVEMEHPEMVEQQKMQKIEQKLMHGQELSADEVSFLEKSQRKQMDYQKNMQQYMRPPT
ncbi:hypothetical protein KJ765_03510 [Candidatus Micrarchaeota archaeon]|nr:hypothetical protein [Candidatus Micrarchaeota archaeon]